MLRCTATAAQPTRTTAYLKLFEVYHMQYDSLAGTSALSAGHKHCVNVIFTHTTLHCGTRRAMHSEYSSSNSHVASACKGSKGDASLASGCHHYRVNIRGDRRRDGLPMIA